MKHKWKIAGAMVGALLLVVAAIPFFLNINTFKPIIENQLSAALGRQVKLGDLSLSILSGTVDAHDLIVADDPQFSVAPFVTASVFHIGIQMRRLIFDHKILITSLEIESPQIHLVHAVNGAWNFSSLGRSATNQTPGQKQKGIPDFTVDSLSVKNGHAKLEDLPAAGAPQTVDQIDLTVEHFDFAKQFLFTLNAVLPGQAALAMTGKAGPINQHDASKTAFDGQLALHHFDPGVAGIVDKSAGISLLADIDAHAVSDGASVTSSGTIHTQNLQLRPDAVPAPKPIDISYNAVHSLSDNTGLLQDATFQTGKLAAHVQGTYNIQPGDISVDLKLAGERIPIDELQALIPAVGVKLPNGSVLKGGTLTTHLTIVGPLRALVINGPVELANTRLAGWNPSSQLKGIVSAAAGDTGDITTIQEMRAQLQVTQAGVGVSNFFISIPAIGDAVGKGTVSPSGALNFMLSMKINTSLGVGGKAMGLLTKMNGTAGKTAAEAAATGLPVTITGTASKPIITPDASGMMKSNGKQLTSRITGIFKKKK